MHFWDVFTHEPAAGCTRKGTGTYRPVTEYYRKLHFQFSLGFHDKLILDLPHSALVQFLVLHQTAAVNRPSFLNYLLDNKKMNY